MVEYLGREATTMKETQEQIQALRNKYIAHPPEGMTKKDVRTMSDEALLDMHYFLNEDEFDDDDSDEGFFLF